MRKITCLLSLVTCLFDTPAAALDLSFDAAVEKIISESHDIKKATANMEMAQAGLDAANSNRWFKIDANAQYMNMVDVARPLSGQGSPLPPEIGGLLQQLTGQNMANMSIPDNIFTAGVTITQPIYTFGKIGNAVEGMRSAIKTAESGAELTRREVRYAAANLYWTAKMTDDLVGVYQKNLADAVSARKQLTSAGRANRANLIKIESDIAAKEIALSDAEFNRDTAHRMLKIMAGIDADEPLTLTDELPSKFGAIEFKKLESNPEWDLFEQQVKMYEANARSKRAGNYPTLAAMGSYSFSSMGTSMDTMFAKSGGQSAYWGVALTMPIFSGGLNRAQATVEAMNAEAAYQDLEKSKKLRTEEYNTAMKRYDHLRGNLAKMVKARDLAARAYKLSADRFAAGQTSAVELADVSAALAQMDMALLSAKYNILMSAESIKKLGN